MPPEDRAPPPSDEVGEALLPLLPPITARAAEWHWEAADEAAARLAQRPTVFLTDRAAMLVRVEDREGYPARIQELTPTRIVDEFGRAPRTRFLEGAGEDKRYVLPPPPLVQTIIERRPLSAGWRPLAGLSPGPYILPSGRIFLEPGYSYETRLWLPSMGAARIDPVSLRPRGYTQEEACLGVARLCAELREFCWGDDNLDPAVWLSYLFTMLTRPGYDVAPLHLFVARKPGSGKDLLFMLAEIIAMGHPAKHIPADADKAELGKLIGTALRGGATPIVLGDIAQIGQGMIYQLISEPHLTTIRVLGASEEIPVPPTMMLGASANNVKFDKDDMFRRMVMLNLDPKTAHPERRTFARDYDQLIQWFYDNRPTLLAAAMNILRGYVYALRDGFKLPKGLAPGSFAGWARMVRDCIRWCDLPDIVQTQQNARSAVTIPGADAIGTILQAMWELWRSDQNTAGAIVKTAKLPTITAAEIGAIRWSALGAEGVTEAHQRLCEGLDLLMPGKWTSSGLTLALQPAEGAQEIQNDGQPMTVFLHRGRHDNQSQWSLRLTAGGKL